MIVEHHPPEQPTLERTIWRLLGPRLRGGDPAADPLPAMAQGMAQLAVPDADRQLAGLLSSLVVPGPPHHPPGRP